MTYISQQWYIKLTDMTDCYTYLSGICFKKIVQTTFEFSTMTEYVSEI